MQIQGQRVHIAGSASQYTSPALLQYAHELIFELVKRLAAEGATFIVGVGKEPFSDPDIPPSLPIIFDWTVLAAIRESLETGTTEASSLGGRIVATAVTSKIDTQIPEARRELWEFLHEAEAIDVEFLSSGWSSGALRRQRMSRKGDILIAIGGGEGVEHLAEDEYLANAKPVIPLDLKIGSSCDDGSGGASRLAGEALAAPHRFVRISDTTLAGSLLSRLTTRQGQKTVGEVIQAVIRLIQAIESPQKNGEPAIAETRFRSQQSIFTNTTAQNIIIHGSINQNISSGNPAQPANALQEPSSKRTILFLASSPVNEARLRLDREAREIAEGLRRATRREQFMLEQCWAVQPGDLRRSLLDINPQIVHFSGHGTGSAGLALENAVGSAQLVPTQAIANLFKLFASRSLECVVLNACYSEVQAKEIAQYISYVVGMSAPITDAAAIKFAIGFYDALGAGWSYEEAFEMGCNAIALEGIPEELAPVIHKRID